MLEKFNYGTCRYLYILVCEGRHARHAAMYEFLLLPRIYAASDVVSEKLNINITWERNSRKNVLNIMKLILKQP